MQVVPQRLDRLDQTTQQRWPFGARLLIADELSLGLAPIVVDEVYRTLEQIREAGTTLLIVEQHVHHALAIADDAIVLVKGEVAYSGPVSELGDLQSRVLGGGGDGPVGPVGV